MLHFEYIQLLWLLVLIPILIFVFYYALYKKKKVAKLLGDENLINQLTKNYNSKAYHKKFILLLVSIAFIILAIANLRTKTGAEKITRNGLDIMIALDVSKSMYAKDVQPNRLERAKQIINKLIDKLSNDRIGIVIFAGKAYLQMPITGDHTATKMYLAAATPETVPTQGTVIGDALKMCLAAFNSKEKKYKSVLLFSDGEDHDNGAEDVAADMASNGIIVNAIGIGSAQGAPIIDELSGEEKKDENGNIVISKINEDALSKIAKEGNGTYQLYTNTDDVVANLLNQLAQMDKRKVEDNSLANYKSLFQILLGVAFLFLLVELFISENKKLKIAAPKHVALLLIFLSSNLFSFAQTQNEFIKNGNDAYKKNDFETAIKNYTKSLEKTKNAIAQNNLGNALYKANKKDEALNAFDLVIENATNADQKSNAYYNKGVVLQNNKKINECIEAYKKALVFNATNTDARHNLQLALKQLQQQQEQQKKEEEKNKKEQKKDNENKKNDNEPKPQQSNISKNDAEQKLDALQQKEKQLQDKLHKGNTTNVKKQDKDW